MKHLQRGEGDHFNGISKGIEKDVKGVRTALLDVQRIYRCVVALFQIINRSPYLFFFSTSVFKFK